MSYESFLMDMATIPPSDNKKEDPESDDDLKVEDPENEEELKAMLGL